MAMNGPIVLVEDDTNDIEIVTAALKELNVHNELRVFPQCADALQYLRTTTERPFFILCDIRMSGLNGLAFRKAICDDRQLRRKSIPFLFFTAAVSIDIVNEAYDMQVQGFIQKANSYGGIKEQLSAVMVYWQHCLHPNKDLQLLRN